MSKNSIHYVGVGKVVQVLANNQSNCKSMGRMLMAKYPHIRCTPCLAYSVDY